MILWTRRSVALCTLLVVPACSSSESNGPSTGGAGSAAAATGGGNPGGTANSGGAGMASGGGGSGGFLSGSGGGNATGAATGSGASAGHCAPGELRIGAFGNGDRACDEPTMLTIPNGATTFPYSIGLKTPTVPGVPYTLSFDVSSQGTRPSAELWGMDGTCGAAQELLWWGPLDQSVQCVTFTPTRAYSSVVLAMRLPLGADDYVFALKNSTECGGAGQCPAGTSGHALSPGVTLNPPLGVYKGYSGSNWYKRREFQIGVTGRLMAKFASDPPDGATTPIASGLFRLDPATPHGDAWYCVGPGSTYSHTEKGNWVHHNLALRNVTRAACPAGGNGSVRVEGAAPTVTSTFGLAAPPAGFEMSCFFSRCGLGYDGPQGVHNWIDATTASSVGHSNAPISTPTTLVDTFVLRRYDDDRPTQFGCGSSGTILFNPPNTTFEATGMSDWAACPESPTGGETVELEVVQFH